MNAYQRWFLWLTGLMMLLSATQPYAVRAAVTLVSMTAAAESDGTILVEWETATELETASFRLYRDLAASGPWTEDKIVDEQPGQGDGITGATYSFSDGDVEAGKKYYYLLEEIDNSGKSTKLNDFIRSATVLAPGQATFTPTATRTATSGPSPTPTRTRTPVPTSTPWPTATDPATDVPTATRQFANTPLSSGNTPTRNRYVGARPADGDAASRIANRDTHHVAAVGDADAFAGCCRASCASRSHTTGQRRAADCCATCGRDRDVDADAGIIGDAYRSTHAICHAFAGRFWCKGDGRADLARHAGPDDCAGSR